MNPSRPGIYRINSPPPCCDINCLSRWKREILGTTWNQNFAKLPFCQTIKDGQCVLPGDPQLEVDSGGRSNDSQGQSINRAFCLEHVLYCAGRRIERCDEIGPTPRSIEGIAVLVKRQECG